MGRKKQSGRALPGANLEEHGQNVRLRVGAVMLAVALALTVILVQADVARGWRLTLFVPFFFATLGAWQGLYRTCPGLARAGRCEARGEAVSVKDPERVRASRWLARRVLLGATAAALVATGLVASLP